jgi:predicted transposase YbfD/YdcC
MSIRYQTLGEVFADVQDVRKAKGKRHRLSAILSLAAAAMMCGYKSYSAMAEWGRHYGHEVARALGFTHEKTPCAATFHNVFRRIDRAEFEGKLAVWAEHQKVTADELTSRETAPSVESSDAPSLPPVSDAVAVDGKSLRGSRAQGAEDAHLLSAVDHRHGLTRRQMAGSDKSHEIPAAKQLLSAMPLSGRVVTMDALLTQHEIAQQILDQGADYVMIVKGNQPTLYTWVKATLDTVSWYRERPGRAQTLDVGQGRIERRSIITSGAMAGDDDWPGLQQVFQIERTVIHQPTGRHTQEAVYGISSLTRSRAEAAALLTLVRHHWPVENKSHWVRDVTFDQDRSQVRTGSIPQVMAALRNAVIGLMRSVGETNIATAGRRFAARPWAALSLLGIIPHPALLSTPRF